MAYAAPITCAAADGHGKVWSAAGSVPAVPASPEPEVVNLTSAAATSYCLSAVAAVLLPGATMSGSLVLKAQRSNAGVRMPSRDVMHQQQINNVADSLTQQQPYGSALPWLWSASKTLDLCDLHLQISTTLQVQHATLQT